MNLKDMTVEELEARMAAIPADLDKEDADLDALEAEARSIKQELEERKAAEAQRNEIRAKVAADTEQKGKKIMEDNKRTLEEIRSSKEYMEAFAEYVKTGKDNEVRALLSENVTGGTVPVPAAVEGRIRTAWERSGVLELVRKTYVRGNLKIGFEISATGAAVHTEGGAAVTAETLTLGVATLIPASIKKLIQVSDEALDMGAEEFLDYLYDELTYQIAKKAEEVLLQAIITAPTTATATKAAVGEISVASLGLDSVVKALGALNPEAQNPVIVITRSAWADLKAAAIAAQYAVDPFEGLPVYFANSTALNGALMVVGDFGLGAHANFPNGEELKIKFDDLSDAPADLVNIIGRMYVGLGIVANNMFVRVVEQ